MEQPLILVDIKLHRYPPDRVHSWRITFSINVSKSLPSADLLLRRPEWSADGTD